MIRVVNDSSILKHVLIFRFGPRFIAVNRAYDKGLIRKAKEIAKEVGVEHLVKEGVYALLGGPSFETVAELRMLRMCGVDAVGK
jgi:purine-nucleoside phosphorylase